MLVTMTLTTLSRNTGEPMWFAMLVDQATIGEVYDRLGEVGAIVGHRIETDRKGARLIERERVEMIVGVNVVGIVRPCHLDIDLTPSSARGQA